jgi:predicted NBD/HSP70 family sugar kinase
MIKNTAELRSYNTKRIIDYVRWHGAITKKKLTSALELSFATVSTICNQLFSDGILEESGSDSSSGGRIPRLLSLREISRLTICLNLLRHGLYDISIADLMGKELCSETIHTDDLLSLNDLIERLIASARTMLRGMGRSFDGVLGIGVAAPGIFDHTSGRIVNSMDPFFENAPLKAALEARFGLPVCVENESNLLATAASLCGGGNNRLHDLIYLYVGEGVGVGIISNGTLVAGSHGMGGEIEHMPIGMRGFDCYCGNKGCVETELGERGFLRKFAEARGGDDAEASVEWGAFLDAVRARRPEAMTVIEENGRLLGKLVSILINIFDPEIVYVGGIVEEIYGDLNPWMRKEIADRMAVKAGRNVPVTNDTNYRAMVHIGCTALVFNEWRV